MGLTLLLMLSMIALHNKDRSPQFIMLKDIHLRNEKWIKFIKLINTICHIKRINKTNLYYPFNGVAKQHLIKYCAHLYFKTLRKDKKDGLRIFISKHLASYSVGKVLKSFSFKSVAKKIRFLPNSKLMIFK